MDKNAIKATLATLGIFIGIGLFFWFVVINHYVYIFYGLITLSSGLLVGIIGYIAYCTWQHFYIKFKRK